MPAQKRSPSENLDEEDEDEESMQQHCRRKQLRREDNDDPITDEKELQDDDEQEDNDEDDEDSDGGVSDPDDLPEFVEVKLTDVRKDVECPICLGIIKKTRTVMECMHRFCRVCIDKAMRLGNNECPACRTHCASRRSLRDDPRYDAMIACIFPDIKKYEEEELAFYEEEKTRNKQIQESIAQIFRRQSEALVKRRTMGKDIAAESTPRLPRNYRNAYSRRKRNNRITEIQGSDDNEDENDQDPNKDSSSTDEHGTEIKQRRYKRRTGARCTQPSPQAAADSSGGCNENETEGSKDIRGTSPGIAWNTEGLTWGGGGARSNTRHGAASGNKGNRSSRVSKLVEYIQNLKENDDELDVHLKLISLDKQKAPMLELPHLCCHSSLSVKHLCHYIAQKTQLQAEDFEMLLVKDTPGPDTNGEQSTINASTSMDERNSMWQVIGGCKSGLQILEGPETLARLKDNCIASRDHLILAYRQKESKQQTDDKLL